MAVEVSGQHLLSLLRNYSTRGFITSLLHKVEVSTAQVQVSTSMTIQPGIPRELHARRAIVAWLTFLSGLGAVSFTCCAAGSSLQEQPELGGLAETLSLQLGCEAGPWCECVRLTAALPLGRRDQDPCKLGWEFPKATAVFPPD